MLNKVSRTRLLGGWLAAVAVIVAWSVAMGARLSTSALLLAMGIVPVVMVLIGAGGPSPTVAEILHAENAKDSR